MVRLSRRLALASELATVVLMRARYAPSASMKKLTVEPVPTPMVASSSTYLSAACAAAFFCASWLMGREHNPTPPNCYACGSGKAHVMKNTDYLEKILTARVHDVPIATPLELAPPTSP